MTWRDEFQLADFLGSWVEGNPVHVPSSLDLRNEAAYKIWKGS